MKKAILATKVGMTQIFKEDGSLVPVTVLQAGPCVVTQIKTVENDGYEAVQVGFVDKKERITNKDKNGKKEVVHRHGVGKAMKGHFDKAGVPAKRYVRETASTEVPWLMVQSSIAIRVLTEHVPLPAACLKGKECPATWAA